MTTPLADDQISKAMSLLGQGDTAGAERIAQSGGANDPGALHLLGMVRVRQNRMAEAADLIGRALAVAPGQPQMLFNYGKILAALGRDGEALKALAAAAAALPDHAEGWNSLGEVQMRSGDIAGAEQSLRKALVLQPMHLTARLALGVALNMSGQSEESAAILAPGLAQAADNALKAAFAYNLAEAQLNLGKHEAALDNLAKVRVLDPAGSGILDFTRANILVERARVDEAEKLLADVVRREPANPEAHIAYNQLLQGEKRDTDFLSSFKDAPQTSALHLAKASLLAGAGRAPEAREIYDRVLAAEPGNVQAAMGVAQDLNRNAHHGEAVAVLEKSLARNPDDVGLESNLAAAALQAGDPQKAAALALKILARNPHDQPVLALLGSAWRLMGDPRHEILNGYDELIQVFDLEAPDGYADMAAFNAELNEFLSTLHRARHRDEIQSLRGGSMTYGHLFRARHPLVEKLRQRIDGAITRFIGGLAADAGHPFKTRRAQGFRYEGSWSSRLAASGRHVNHVHHEGWISSAYYVDVPKAAADAKKQEGWIKFGEPVFDIGLKPVRTVQPVPGRLVLFPSYMWHGTIPFTGDTRTTIAFDVVPR
jgi:predicted Zn-dependent protease